MTRTDPWARMDGEPERDYARFHSWLALPDRRLARAAPMLGLKRARLEGLSATWSWQSRAAAFDLHQARRVQEETLRLRSEAAHVLAQGILGAARARLAAPDEENEVVDLQRLATALKALAPTLDVSVSQPVDTGYTEDQITVAIRRARELEAADFFG